MEENSGRSNQVLRFQVTIGDALGVQGAVGVDHAASVEASCILSDFPVVSQVSEELATWQC
jgi:hypothetical protein